MPSLIDVIIEKGIVTKRELTEVLSKYRGSGKSLEEVLVESGLIDENKLARLIASVTPYRMIKLREVEIDKSVVKLIPADIARKHLIFPVARAAGYISVAMANPLAQKDIETITRVTRLKPIPFVSSIGEIIWAIEKYYEGKELHVGRDFSGFSELVVHEGNKFAVSIAKELASLKKKGIVIFYGPEGVGKTTLLKVIVEEAERANLRSRFYTPARFKAAFSDAQAGGFLRLFLGGLSSLDILAFDDIDFTFKWKDECVLLRDVMDEIVEKGGAIALSLSRGIEFAQLSADVKIKSLMEGGLLVPINPPDEKTKLKVLSELARDENVHISADVLKFIADKSGSNWRRLRGAIVQLKSLEEYSGREIPDEVAKTILRRYLS